MKFKNKVVIEFIISLFLLLGSASLFAEDFYFQCQSENIPNEAKGIYRCTGSGKMYYITPENKTLNLFESPKGVKIQSMTACFFATTSNGTEFTTFDKFGNFYFATEAYVEENGKTEKYVTFIYKYNPVKNEVSTFRFKANTTFRDLCISEDGRWLFVDITEEVDRTNWCGFPKIYAVETSFDKVAVLLYSSYYNFSQDNMLFNLCFDSNTKSINFCNLGWNQKDDSHIGMGFYTLYPDENGVYKPENLKCRYGLDVFFYERILNNVKKANKIDYGYILDALKYSCHSNQKLNDIELNLSYFKDSKNTNLNGKNYSALYAEDSNGNSLKNYEAVKHLYQNSNLFMDFVYAYNSKYSIKRNLIPLNILCYIKDTNQPAWKYDKDSMEKPGFNEVGFLYSNKDGIWELSKQDDGTRYSYIYHLTDEKGNFIGERLEKDSLPITCNSIWSAPKPIVVTHHGVNFMTIDGKTIYHYEDGELTDVSKLAGNKDSYIDSDLSRIAEMLENESVKRDEKRIKEELNKENENQIKLAEQNQEIKKITAVVDSFSFVPVELSDSDEGLLLHTAAQNIYEMKNEREQLEISLNTYKKKVNIFSILLIILSIIVVNFAIIIIYFSARTKKLTLIKNNKRFIYDIQEKERGKISRDIHDSIIQDIRAIRIESELLKVEADSEDRKNKIIQIATDCVVKLRNICYNLTPAELTTHNHGDSTKIELISIIQSLVIQFIERTHVPCQIKIDENFDYPVLPKDVSQNLFRIIQEALNNIEKHSYATNCQILIKNKTEDNKKFMLIYVSDDGVGCDIENVLKKRKKDHFGLGNMIDRAELIGVTIDFQSEQGQGMEVRIKI